MRQIDARDPAAVQSVVSRTFGEWGRAVLLTKRTITRFGRESGDMNAIHFDVEVAKKGPFGAITGHGDIAVMKLPMLRPPPTFEFLNVKGMTRRRASQAFRRPIYLGEWFHGRERVRQARSAARFGVITIIAYEVAIVGGPRVMDGTIELFYPFADNEAQPP